MAEVTTVQVIQQPTFDPAYVPASDGNGGYRPDSILIQCVTETTNNFIYNAWDGVARWFVINGPDGEVVFQGVMEVGDTVELPNVTGYVVHYYSGDVYTYGVVPGQCTTAQSTTTVPQTTTTPPTTEAPTTSTTPSSTTTPIETTTSVSVPSTEVSVEGTVTSLVPLTELQTSTNTQLTGELPSTGFGAVEAGFLGLLLVCTGAIVRATGAWKKFRTSN